MWKATNLANLLIPRIKCPSSTVSPFLLYAKEEGHKWENNNLKMANQEAFVRQDYPLCVAMAYPRVKNKDRLLMASKVLSIIFAFDTDLELMITNKDVKGIESYVDIALRIMGSKPYDKKYTTLIALDNLLKEYRETATDYQHMNLIQAFRQFFLADRYLSINFNLQMKLLPINRYFYISRPNSAVLVTVALIDYTQDFCLGRVYYDRDIISISNIANDYITLANDACSFPKEYLNFEIKNYIICYSIENKCSLQQAIDATFKLFYEKEKYVYSLVDNIKTNKNLYDNNVNLWIQGLFELMYGLSNWYYISERYSTFHINYNDSVIIADRIQQIQQHSEEVGLTMERSLDISRDLDKIMGYFGAYWKVLMQ